MVERQKGPPYKGKTYSLYGDGGDTDGYYRTIRELTDRFLTRCPDEKSLLKQIQRASSSRPFKSRFPAGGVDNSLISFVRKTLRESLPIYTTEVKEHLRIMPLRQRFDPILRTKREQYHLYMIEIELVNRIYKEAFRQSKYRFALIAHCLRDFRPDCRSVSGDIEAICKNCTKECFINIGSLLLKKYGIHPYISVSMDFDKLFRKLKSEHKSVGALGIGCVPELSQGMRLCIKLGLSPIGIPLDANRCARWMKETRESSFNLRELEELVK
jgi:hypothetical protein